MREPNKYGSFFKRVFCGVPVLAGWVYAFCGSMSRNSENAQFRNHLLDLSYLYKFFIIS